MIVTLYLPVQECRSSLHSTRRRSCLKFAEVLISAPEESDENPVVLPHSTDH